MVESWKLDPHDTHPWVWIWRVPGARSHIFVGSSIDILREVKSEAAKAAHDNFIAISQDMNHCHHHHHREMGGAVDERLFHILNCALLHGEIAELDAEHSILMLDDERIMEFDMLTIVNEEEQAEGSVHRTPS